MAYIDLSEKKKMKKKTAAKLNHSLPGLNGVYGNLWSISVGSVNGLAPYMQQTIICEAICLTYQSINQSIKIQAWAILKNVMGFLQPSQLFHSTC